jgi:hypothetical protein
VEDWAKRQGSTEGGARHAVPGQFSNDWSEENLRRALLGHWCRFEGWLFFDSHHAGESENVAPGTTANWRATAWELHPVTKIEVLK